MVQCNGTLNRLQSALKQELTLPEPCGPGLLLSSSADGFGTRFRRRVGPPRRRDQHIPSRPRTRQGTSACVGGRIGRPVRVWVIGGTPVRVSLLFSQRRFWRDGLEMRSAVREHDRQARRRLSRRDFPRCSLATGTCAWAGSQVPRGLIGPARRPAAEVLAHAVRVAERPRPEPARRRI